MALRLPRLPSVQPNWGNLQRWWQSVVEAIEGQEATQDELLAMLTETTNRMRRILSHTSPTTIMTTTENGTTATIVVADHTRVYGDGTLLTVTGGTESGLVCDTPYAAYYDDVTLADATPTIVFTQNILQAQAVAAAGRHFLGVINTPPAASGKTRQGGGVYPLGSSVGGEL